MQDGEYIYCSSCDVDVHVDSFRRQVISALLLDPVIINVHSGHDSWDTRTATEYFVQVLAIENELTIGRDIAIVHETHRQRQLHSPFQTMALLNRPELRELKINADLSHWVCLCERVFSNPGRDPWWPDLLQRLAEHCMFIHARVGHAEGPQVFDPRRVDLFDNEVNAHLEWWEVIWNCRRVKGATIMYIEPEHGPEPYQSYYTVPIRCNDPGGSGITSSDVESTDRFIVDRSAHEAAIHDEEKKSKILWDINAYVGALAKNKFNSAASIGNR